MTARIDTDKIRRERLRHGLSHRALAEMAGMSTSCVSHLETGRPVEPSTFFKICDALQVNPIDFILPPDCILTTRRRGV